MDAATSELHIGRDDEFERDLRELVHAVARACSDEVLVPRVSAALDALRSEVAKATPSRPGDREILERISREIGAASARLDASLSGIREAMQRADERRPREFEEWQRQLVAKLDSAMHGPRLRATLDGIQEKLGSLKNGLMADRQGFDKFSRETNGALARIETSVAAAQKALQTGLQSSHSGLTESLATYGRRVHESLATLEARCRAVETEVRNAEAKRAREFEQLVSRLDANAKVSRRRFWWLVAANLSAVGLLTCIAYART
jgi:hypothetical protein